MSEASRLSANRVSMWHGSAQVARESGHAVNRATSNDALWQKIDVIGIGLPAVILVGLVVIARVRSDPFIIFPAAYILILYLFGYIPLGGMARLLQINCQMAISGLILMIIGSVGWVADRDAVLLVFLASPGLGIFVSSAASCIDGRRRSDASAPSDDR